ncbi:hypothetical protein KY290_030521 [Solanum tuberosum]|uniref:DUF4218 domain-containing protein n=1 Tax=Solanum tuberosum TaxID=4113 RepID=A0ABQ7UNX7_SOLTU|nr:hypothetical protein KY290_030521 [Solanum tuberosum]
MSSKTSPLMRWHHENKANDGIMRHPVDSKAWKKFDELHQSFAVEPRNVRLGLASDGFQPFGCSRTPYSIWPVVLIPYNLPPWLCIKQENFILSMLIPGPGSPGDEIDVYLQPLIDELKKLWETGVCTFDASTKQNFTLHAALLWTINDFPTYGNLSGWSTKGKLACPCCNRETSSIRANGKKQCYMGHRHFLPLNHKWRNDKKSFDGTVNRRLPPNTLSGDDILDQVADLDGLPLTNDQKKKVKLFIRNGSCVEGSIAEGYIANEFTTFCSRYLHTMETKFNLLERNYDGGAIESDGGLMIFCQPGKALKGGKPHLLDLKEMEQAHIYILNIVMKFNHFSSDSSQKKSDRQFISWFKEKIEGLYEHDDSKKMADLLTLSRGPMKNVTKFKGYIINGYRFHVQDYNNGLRTQNCGIVVSGEAGEEGRIIDYYGELTEILELQFVGGRRLVLFRCMWFDVYDNERGVKMDEYDFDDMNPSIFKKSEMGSSSKNFKQSFLPPGALARGRGKSLKSIGSVRVTAEKRNLIDQTEITLETLRSKSKKEIGHNFTYGGSVKGSIKTNVVPPGFDALKDETSFPNDDLEVMQQTMRSKPAKENGQNITFVCSVKGSIVRGSVEKRTMVGNSKDEKSFPNDDLEVTQQTMRSKPAKENGHNSTYVCSVKESIVRGSVEKRTMVGNSKDEKSFPNDDLEVTQQTMRSKPGSNVVQRTSIGKRKIYCVPSSDKNELAHNKNLMQPGFDPIEVDTFFPSDDLENAIPQKSNVVCPDFDAIEVETSFPHDDHEVMKENMRSKPGKENGKNITSVGSARGSTFVQRTSIGKSKGYSVVSSDMNVRAYNKILRQPDFNPIEHVTSFPHDDLEAMPEALRSKSARERAQSFTYVGSPRRCAEKRTLNGKNKKSKNTEYDLNELTKNNNRVPLGLDPMEDDLTLPQDEVEVMQETRRKGPNLCKVVTGLKPGEKLRVTFYHNRVVEDNHALFSRHLGSLVRDRNMCPLRVHSWTDIEEAKLEHMWGAITEKFDSDDMIGHRDHVLKHMRRLWNNWKGSLHMNVKSKPLREVLKDVPEGVDKSDWEWLVKEHFLSKKFKGGKHGNPPDMATIFFETRKKDNKLLEPETNQKYEEIQELLQVEPSLTNIEVVERCFGPQSKSHVVGFGGGITSKDLKGGSSAKAAPLEQLNVSRKEKPALLEELNASRKENESMKRCMDNIEKRCEMFESTMFRDPSSPPSSSEQNTD